MTGSDIHHMWYGMYSYGHLGGVWTDNEMHGENAMADFLADGCLEEKRATERVENDTS